MSPAGSGEEDDTRDAALDRLAQQTASVVALGFAALLLAIGALMILATAAVAPDAVILALVGGWLGTATVTWQLRRHPIAVLVVPVLLTLTVWALTALGTNNWGWT